MQSPNKYYNSFQGEGAGFSFGTGARRPTYAAQYDRTMAVQRIERRRTTSFDSNIKSARKYSFLKFTFDLILDTLQVKRYKTPGSLRPVLRPEESPFERLPGNKFSRSPRMDVKQWDINAVRAWPKCTYIAAER